MSDETYYVVLGVAETASGQEIKRAYRSLLKKIHPDTVSTLSEDTRNRAEEATREITEAYSVLSDSGQRAEYDSFLAEQRKASAAAPGAQSDQAPAANSPTNGTAPGDVAVSQEHRRRRKRRRHHRRHSSMRGTVKSLFRPVSLADWLVLICYIFLAIAILTILVVLISSAPSVGSEDRSLPSRNGENTILSCMNGAGDRDRTGDIQLGKLAFYR